MIDNYKIKTDNEEEILFLYINYNYDINSINMDKKGIIRNIRDYILEHRINFNGNKIKLVVSGIVLCTLILNRNVKIDNNLDNNNYSYISSIIFDSDYSIKLNDYMIRNQSNKEVQDNIVEEINVNDEILESDKDDLITVHRSNGEIVQLPLDDYLIGVVAAEMPASFNKCALEAQAIVSRTYTLKLIKENKILTDNNSTQNYKDNEELKMYWGLEFDNNYNKIKEAVYNTKDIVITYDNELIDATFFSTSNGSTEDAINVWGYEIPYLKSVDSSFDINTSQYYFEQTFSYDEISELLNVGISNDTNIILYKNDSGRVSVVYLDGIAFSGVNFRNILGLRSTDFDIIKDDNSIKIITRGYGHGVGMSQYGANYLANRGYNHEQIIKYYYKDVELSNNYK